MSSFQLKNEKKQAFKIEKMKAAFKIIIIFTALILVGLKGYSQGNIQKADTLRVKEQTQTKSELKEQKREGYAYGEANRNNGSQAPKQVKGGRPDMSKARGARPPMIVRPSGSGVPKGVGKPGGVGRKGGR